MTPNTDASASPRLMPARDGGRSGLPVVWRMPPIASPTLPNPAWPASGPVWPKPLMWTITRRGLAADRAA